MNNRVPRIFFCLAVAALVMSFPSTAFAGCGKACYDIECVPDHSSLGCVENFGFCWEVPCFAAAGSEDCSAYEALATAFASFENMEGEEALEKLLSDEKLAEQVLPYLRVVGEDGEVYRGTKYQRPSSLKVAETENSEAAEEDTASADR